MHCSTSATLLLFFSTVSSAAHAAPATPVTDDWATFAVRQLKSTLASGSPVKYPTKTSAAAPHNWLTKANDWTSGFFPGMLWMLGQRTANAELLAAGEAYTAGRAGEASNTGTHDVGFMVFDSFGKGLEYGDLNASTAAAYHTTVLQAADSLASRFSDVVGMTRSWGQKDDEKQFEVIIDNLMNLELLWYAANAREAEGNSTRAARLRTIAVATATNMGKHWIRPDGSTYHLVIFDPVSGAVQSRSGTPQGLCQNCTWARGQAWGVYGFTMAYRFTNDTRFLALAAQVTDFYLDNLPDDNVPKWDFSATAAWGGANRDTSAAAIVASGLLELHSYTGDKRHLAGATAALAALNSDAYRLQEGAGQSILTHCQHDCGGDGCSVVEADYFYVEAMLRAEKIGLAPVSLRSDHDSRT